MLDGLLEYLISFLEPLINALKGLFCWILEVFFRLLTVFLQFITYIFPNWPVPDFMQKGFEAMTYFFTFLNWVLPLGLIGPIFAFMLSAFIIYFIAMPIYRGVMDLL